MFGRSTRHAIFQLGEENAYAGRSFSINVLKVTPNRECARRSAEDGLAVTEYYLKLKLNGMFPKMQPSHFKSSCPASKGHIVYSRIKNKHGCIYSLDIIKLQPSGYNVRLMFASPSLI